MKIKQEIFFKDRNQVLKLATILFFCFILRINFFVGIGINDDIGYIHHAKELAKGNNILANGGSQLAFRTGIIIPLALVYKCFGCSEKTTSIFPILSSVITCMFIYLTSNMLFGSSSAIISSLLWCVYPLQLVFDTQLSPSNQHATCVSASLFLFFIALKHKQKGIDEKLCNRFFFISSFIIGIGWLVNEVFVVVFFGAIPLLLYGKLNKDNLIWLFSGFLFLIFIELLVSLIFSGSCFSRINSIIVTENLIGSNKCYEYLPRVIFQLFNTNPLHDEGHFGIIWHIFIVLNVLMLLFRQWFMLCFAMSAWFILAYFQWGVMSFDGTTITKYIRYLSMLVPFQCIAIGAIIGLCIQKFQQTKWLIFLLTFILYIHLFYFGSNAVNSIIVRTKDFKDISIYLMSQDNKNMPVYMDEMTAQFVEVISGDKLDIRWLEHNIKKIVPKKGYMIVDGSRRIVEDKIYRNRMPEWYLSPPKSWELIHIVKGKKFEFFDTYDPKIYKIK